MKTKLLSLIWVVLLQLPARAGWAQVETVPMQLRSSETGAVEEFSVLKTN